ncbi:GntR family transcriptional regulator [Microbacteriaceae bacterium K1510]|nr:GntR family transcriptional regulator [Microbacteriaceae bacterium K1510]
MSKSDALPQMRHRINPEADRISLYVRLTSILRSRITSGEWKVGDRIPTIEELCTEYDVARNTVRQSLELLRSEGLISSGRGVGTFVLHGPVVPTTDDDLKAAISDPLTLGPEQSIQVLNRTKSTVVPSDLARGLPLYENYTLIRKLHRFRDQPFALMDIYVASAVYKRFPKGQDASIKIARLLRESGAPIAKSQLEITTRPADHETAQLLNYSMAGSLVCMRRWRTDKQGRLVTAGTYLYRGDLFVLDIDEPFAGLGPSRTDIIPRAKRLK